jgi:hypothetical protein
MYMHIDCKYFHSFQRFKMSKVFLNLPLKFSRTLLTALQLIKVIIMIWSKNLKGLLRC